MNILFIHQNFPGQYINIVKRLSSTKNHKIVALGLGNRSASIPKEVDYIRYSLAKGNAPGINQFALELETKLIRAEACAIAAHALKKQGFYPDIICGHPGWGETLFLKNIWPRAEILLYQEFYYHSEGFDYNFDPEFYKTPNWEELSRLQMKNHYIDISVADTTWNVTPTQFQKSTFPQTIRSRLSTIHDGIDTLRVAPAKGEFEVQLEDGTKLKKGEKIITFANRSLEPYRGCHSFIRSIPYIHEKHPDTKIIVIGNRSGVSYGESLDQGEYSDLYFEEIKGQYEQDNVHLVGSLDYRTFLDMLKVTACHVYLTYPFVLSWSLLEAMSTACPIVGSRTMPVEELITSNENGILVDFFNYQEIANAISDILKDKKMANSLGNKARVHIEEKYELDRCVGGNIDLIKMVGNNFLR